MQERSVALCITELDVGGAERCLVELATRLDRRRFEPVVYALARPPEGNLSCLSALKTAGIEVHFLGLRRKYQFPIGVARLAQHFKRQRPDVVQSFLHHAGIVSRLAARWARVPVVVSGIRVAERRGRWPLWLDRVTSGLVDRHVCVSRAVARFSIVEGGLPEASLVVIPNGIDLEPYQNALPADLREAGVASERRLVTYVGRLDPQKGLDCLLRSAGSWLADAPDCDVALVGHGPQRRDLEKRAAEEGISERVHFLGFRADVPAILARSSLLVLPSRWEGMPNVVLEAMAAGLPVVATDVEGVAELLGDHAEEQITPLGDTPAFAAAVARLLKDRDLADQLGQRNRLRAAEYFQIDDMVERYQTLWTELAQGQTK